MLELRLPESHSLKDKRHTAVTVSGDHAFAEQVLQSVEREAASLLGPQLVGVTVEWIE